MEIPTNRINAAFLALIADAIARNNPVSLESSEMDVMIVASKAETGTRIPLDQLQKINFWYQEVNV